MIFAVCQKKYGAFLNKLAVKDAILSKIRGDAIGNDVIQDFLIVLWGDDFLKKIPEKRSKYHLSAKMRSCANLVINMRKLNSSYTNLLSCLKPAAFDDIIQSTKVMAKYDPETRTFHSGCTALHLGTYLMQIADLAKKTVLRKKIPITENAEQCLLQLDRFKDLVENHWTTEVGSLALKYLNRKSSKKPKLLPLTQDIMKLKSYLDTEAEQAYNELQKASTKSTKAYSRLVETTLVSLVLHNARNEWAISNTWNVIIINRKSKLRILNRKIYSCHCPIKSEF